MADVEAEWRAWWASWELSLEAKGRRPRTVEFYERELLRFGEHVEVPPLQVTRPAVRQWILDLIAEGRAPNTVNNRFICVRSFYAWLVAEGELDMTPCIGLSTPPHRGPDPAVLSDAEFEKVLAATAGTGPLQRRNRAIVLTLESSGCRASELVSMTDAGLDLRGRSASVEGKGGAWRQVPLSSQAAEAIDRYRRSRSQLADGKRLWRGHRGDLSVKGLAHMLHRLGEQVGVELHAHRLRHRFSHLWLANGGSEAGLQVAAGWSSVVMPRRYGRSLSVERMLDEHKRMGLGDRY